MYPEIYDFSSIFLSTLFCAMSVKIADDFLDKETDALSHQLNLSHKFGNGIVLYGMLFLGISASFNITVGIPLFLSSYIIGMFHDFGNYFPTRLTGLQESLFIFIIGLLFFGWQMMIFSVLFVFSIQLFDDFLDVCTDKASGHRNFAQRFGRIECILLFILSTLSSYYINPSIFPAVLGAVVVVYVIILSYQEAET